MHRIVVLIVLCALTAGSAAAAGLQINELTAKEAKAWLDYTVPLPKEIQIKAEAVVPKGGVALDIRAKDGHPVYAQIRKEFAETCGSAQGSGENLPFRIQFEAGQETAEALKTLPNSNQAYQILPRGQNTLVVISLSERGAYYGWKTIQQLIKGRSAGDALRIPILTVKDWPDMEKRGLWGTDNYDHIEWLADRKMNHLEQITAQGVDANGNFFAHTRDRPNEYRLEKDTPSFAMDYAPVVLHLEQKWDDNTMGRFYPQMKGKNSPHPRAFCYSEPKTTEMIAEWIYLLAQKSPTREVDVWMSENLQGKEGCQCEGCRKEHHTVNEARVIIKAWEIAKQKLGKYITLYVLTSEATEAQNQKIFSELPSDVRVWYYHSLYTYNSIRQPMLRRYLGEFAKTNWLGVCPNLDAWTHVNAPFTGAAFIKYRMEEFVTKGLKGLLGYATPRVHFVAFNVEAAAEWTWNLKGRSTREFAYSHAVRQGYKDPSLFADWSELIGNVGWDVYGSGWPAGQMKNQGVKVRTALKNGTLPELGYVLNEAWPTPWGNIKTEKQLDSDVAAAKKAIGLAEKLGVPQLIYESYVVDGYIRTIKALYEMKKIAPKGGKFPPDRVFAASRQLREFLNAAKQVVEYLPRWEGTVTTDVERRMRMTARPVEIMTQVAEDVKKTAQEMGAKAD